MRLSSLPILAALLLTAPREAVAVDWATNGAPLCLAPQGPYEPVACADAAGGVTVAWTDLRDGLDSGHVYAARILEDGSIDSSWPLDGLRVSTDPVVQRLPSIIATPDGGALILLQSIGSTTMNIRLQRLVASGQVAPGWPPEGRVVGLPVPSESIFGSMIADSAGDAFVAHVEDKLQSREIRIFKFTPQGEPHPDWPVDGVPALSHAAARGTIFQGILTSLHSDRQGGVWLLSRLLVSDDNSEAMRWHLVRVDSKGSIPPGWPGGEARIIFERNGTSFPRHPGAVVSGGSFLFSIMESPSNGIPGYVQAKICDPDGAVRDLGRLGESEGPVYLKSIHSDGQWGAFFELEGRLWRLGFAGMDPQIRWSRPFLNNTDHYEMGRPFVDHEGGLYNMRNPQDFSVSQPRLRLVHLLGETGAWDPPSSEPGGVAVSMLDPIVGTWCGVRTRAGGLALFWAGNRRGEYDLYYTGSATAMSTRISTLRVEAEGGRVEIEWWLDEPGARDLRLERRDLDADWEACGSVEQLAGGRVLAVDPEPPPSAFQEYRLVGFVPSGALTSDPVRVELGWTSESTLEAPSPQHGGVRFRVGGPGTADVDVLVRNVSGRIVARNPGRVGDGRWDRFDLPPGLYWLTVRRGADETTRRVVVLP